MRRRLLVQNAFRFDRSQFRPAEAVRCTLGLALPLGLAVLAGQPAWGVLAATGALNAGLASYSGVTRSRLRLMLTTSFVTAAMTVLGVLVGQNTTLASLAVLISGTLLALYGVASPAATTISLQAITVLIVIIGLELPLREALPTGLLVLLGALVQTLLLAVVWPASRRDPERRMVANVYRSLARFVEHLPDEAETGEEGRIPDALPLQNAWAMLDEAKQYRWRGEHAALHRSLQAAEELRAALTGLSGADAALERAGGQQEERAAQVRTTLAHTLRRLEGDLRRGLAAAFPDRTRSELETLRQAASGLESTDPAERDLEHWTELLVAQLERLLQPDPQPEPDEPPASVAPAIPAPRPPLLTRLYTALTRLPQSLPLSALVWRHALRYGLALGLSTLAYRVFGVSHGYWLPLTVAVLLRQDYAATLTRGVARLSGTLAGVVLATLLVWLLHPGGALLSLLSLGAAFLTFTLFLTNYAVFSLSITLYVVFSVEAAGIPGRLAAETRVGATLLGGVLALVIFRLWPSWQRRQARAMLQDALQAHLDYAEAVAALTSVPGNAGLAGAALAARQRSRALRLQAEGLLQAATLEPGLDGDRALPHRMLERLNASAVRLLALHAEALAGQAQATEAGAVVQESRQLAEDCRALSAVRPQPA